MLTIQATLDLALSHSLRDPKLARAYCLAALGGAIRVKRPDLAYAANALLGAL